MPPRPMPFWMLCYIVTNMLLLTVMAAVGSFGDGIHAMFWLGLVSMLATGFHGEKAWKEDET